ncbi:MAG: glycosyltransferase family 4 protein [Rikenellaceae bacterium]
MKTLFIIVNIDVFFLSHRREIAVNAREAGYDVTIVTKDSGQLAKIAQMGFKTIDLPMNKSGQNLAEEMQTLKFLYNLYRQHKPDIVHHVGLKVILWGSLAAKFARVNGVVNAVSGLGIFFNKDNTSLTAKLMPHVLKFAHRRKNLAVIFQNNEDKALFLNNKIINPEQVFMIKGSGVDLNQFAYTPEPTSQKIRVLFTARMVVDKGIFVLTDAAEKLRERYADKVEFVLCGGLEDNPNAAKEEDLNAVCDGEYIKWIGYSSNVLGELQQCHIVAFPSYYKEGLPKSLIEANAVGRPIITTDSIGCRDTVDDGANGYIIPIKDSDALAAKLAVLIDSKDLRVQMGLAARAFAERDFSIENVVTRHLDIYNKLTNKEINR